MNADELLKQIIDYLKKDTSDMLLIKGKWGAGKTYFWKDFVEKYENGAFNKEITQKYKIVTVSLFGVSTAQELRGKIIGEYFEKRYSSLKIIDNLLPILFSLIAILQFTMLIIITTRLDSINLEYIFIVSITLFITSLIETYLKILTNIALQYYTKLNLFIEQYRKHGLIIFFLFILILCEFGVYPIIAFIIGCFIVLIGVNLLKLKLSKTFTIVSALIALIVGILLIY